MTEGSDLAAFRDCDVRGVYPDELDEDLFLRIGWALGREICAACGPDDRMVVVGGDARLSTPSLRQALLAGLVCHPVHVFDLGGQVPTPAIYWSKSVRKAHASAFVTASHNPPSWNGLKVMNGALPPYPEDISALAKTDCAAAIRQQPRCGTVEAVPDEVGRYLADLHDQFADRGIARLKVAVDPGNGCFSGRAAQAFRDLGASVIALHDTIDGLFRERHPDCAIPVHLKALQAASIEHAVDFGVAFDGDGDRINVVDGRGRVLGAERLAMILLRGPLKPAAGDRIILEVKCSIHLERLVAGLGAEPVRCKSGHAFMKRTVLERQAFAGIEISGHIFLREIEGRDDPLYTALMLAAWLSQGEHKLAELVDGLPPMFMTEDIRIALPPDEINRIIAACGKGLAGATAETMDGVRLVWPDGWLLARRSITEPKITVRLEGETPGALGRIGARFGHEFPTLAGHIAGAIEKALAVS